MVCPSLATGVTTSGVALELLTSAVVAVGVGTVLAVDGGESRAITAVAVRQGPTGGAVEVSAGLGQHNRSEGQHKTGGQHREQVLHGVVGVVLPLRKPAHHAATTIGSNTWAVASLRSVIHN